MALVLHHGRRKSRPEITVQVAESLVLFVRRTFDDGSVGLVAEVEDEATLRAMHANPAAFTVLGEARLVDEPRARDEAPAMVATSAGVPAPVAAALRNGWSASDLLGAGEFGQWGPDGGRSARTGLTMSEMALSVPPQGWPELVETVYPWQVLGWRAPGDGGWKPPAAPSKIKEEEVPPPAGDAIEDETPDGEALEGEAGEGPAPVEAAPAARPAATKPTRAATPPPATRPEEALQEWTADQTAKAVAILTDLWRTGNKPPTRSKAGYYFRGSEFPKCTDAAFQALLDRVSV